GLSVPGPGDGMPFYLGPLHLILAALGVRAAWQSRDREQRHVAAAAVLMTAGAVALTLEVSRVVWQRASILAYFAYPWRLLAVPAPEEVCEARPSSSLRTGSATGSRPRVQPGSSPEPSITRGGRQSSPGGRRLRVPSRARGAWFSTFPEARLWSPWSSGRRRC